jgi:hypothetical protein
VTVGARPPTLVHRVHTQLVSALPGAPLTSDPTGVTGWTYVWLALAVLFATFCGVESLRAAFIGPNVVQDDARTFLFWTARYADPELFQNDLIADYFEAVSPPGYTALNWAAAVVFHLDPLVLNKLLPAALGLVTTAFMFRLCMALLPVPVAAFAATTILNESIWLSDGLTSGTPRAFIYPIFAALLYYLVTDRALETLIAVALLGLFYPQFLTIAVGTLFLTLVRFEYGRLRLRRSRRQYLICAGALLIALPLVLWGALLSSRYGPTLTESEARGMLELSPFGRTAFFTPDAWRFWITGERTGVLPFSLKPPMIWLSLLLPPIVALRSRFALSSCLSERIGVLSRITIVSFGMYFAAHLLLFNLHLPSRYTQHSLRFVMSIGAGLALTLLVDWIGGCLEHSGRLSNTVSVAARVAVVALACGAILLYPAVYPLTRGVFPYAQYVVGREVGLYRYLESTPKSSVIASMSTQIDMIPTMAKRSILSGYEYGIPYHTRYYAEIRRRTHDLLRVEYTPDIEVVRRFFATYRVSYLLIDRSAYSSEYVQTSVWMAQTQPEASIAIGILNTGQHPVIMLAAQRCGVYADSRFVLLDAACIVVSLTS